MGNPLLNYRIYGEQQGNEDTGATTLVFLHGMLGELQNWNTQAKRFATAGYKVMAIDLRNHGESPHIKDMSYRQMSDDVLALLAHLEVSDIYLSGHSMGGKVAMYLALNYPEKIQKLIVVDIAPVAYPPWHQQLFHALLSLPVDTISSRQEADALLADHFDDPFERAFLLKNLKHVEGQYEWKCDLLEIAKNYLKISGFPVLDIAYSGKVLFIKGEDSSYITKEHKAKILHYFPEANVVTIANAGHLPHVQQADVFYDYVFKFLTHPQ